MKNIFRSFYDHFDIDKLKEVWKEENTLFVFDTNTLLDLYSYRPQPQEEFFNYLSKVKDQTWLPFHVGLELHNNRIKVIKINEKKHQKVDSLIEDICKLDLSKKDQLACNYVKDEYPEIYKILEELTKELPKKYTPIKSLLDKAAKDIKNVLEVPEGLKTNYFAHKDSILDRLNKIYTEDKIGASTLTTQEQIEDLWEEAKKRWSTKTPPGYEDYNDKKEKTFIYDNLKHYNALGDLIIFNEIKNYITNNQDIINLVFISNDNKEDWRSFVNHENKVDLGARHELRSELFEASKNLNFFEIINSAQFLEISAEIHGNHLSAEIRRDIETAKSSYDDHKLTVIYNKLNVMDSPYEELISTFRNKMFEIDDSIPNHTDLSTYENKNSYPDTGNLLKKYKFHKKEEAKLSKHLENLNLSLKVCDLNNDAEYLPLLAEQMAIKNALKKTQDILKSIEDDIPKLTSLYLNLVQNK